MLLIVPSRLQMQKQSWVANVGLFIFAFSLFIFMSIFGGEEVEEVSAIETQEKIAFSYETIGCGPLALNGMRNYIPVPILRTELILLGKNTRPDAIKKTVFLGLKSTSEEKVVHDGELVYLRQASPDQFSFSFEKTHLSIRPIFLEDESVLLEVTLYRTPVRGKGLCAEILPPEIDVEAEANLNESWRGRTSFLAVKDQAEILYKSLESGIAAEEGNYVMKETPPVQPEQDPLYAKELQKAVAWGHDLLFKNYGGEEYFSFREKVRIEFGEGEDAYVCFVEPGDLLIWTEDKWQPVSLENFSPHLPLARVAAVSAHEMELETWDETGFWPLSVKIGMHPPTRLPGKIEEIFSSLRPRTASEMTCLIGKRRVVLKEGDWWLKTENGWHNLRSWNEIEDLLQHKLRGELVIFDRMENEKGKTVLKGHFFDAMRTQMQPIALITNSEKKTPFAGRKTPHSPTLVARSEEKIP